MAIDIPKTIDYITLLMQAIMDGRIEAKTVRDMTPEQREEWKQKLLEEEQEAIDSGLSRHTLP